MHEIDVTQPDQALQLRGGKSSVVTWAQREMEKYRRLTAISVNRIRKIRKEADTILATAEGSQLVPPTQHTTTATVAEDGTTSKQQQQQHRVPTPDTRIQMLRRMVSSKSVLALQAQSTAPASRREAELWTKEAPPPRSQSAILSVIASGKDDDDGDVNGFDDEEEMALLLAAARARQQKESSSGQQQHQLLNSNNSGGNQHHRAQASGGYDPTAAAILRRRSKKTARAHAGGDDDDDDDDDDDSGTDPLERLLQDRLELLVGGVSPGVMVAEATQPNIQPTPLRKSATGRGAISRRAGSASSSKLKSTRNVSEIDPYKAKTPKVLVQKTPQERKRILAEAQEELNQKMMAQQQHRLPPPAPSSRPLSASAAGAGAGASVLTSPADRSAHYYSHDQHDDGGGIMMDDDTTPLRPGGGGVEYSATGIDHTPAVSSVHEMSGGQSMQQQQQQQQQKKKKKPLLLAKPLRRLHIAQPKLWEFDHHVSHPDDIAHWNIVQQLAVKAMQQPPKDETKKGGHRR